MGTTVLMGGDEFRPSCRSMDEALLQRTGKASPSVVILPTAAARENPRLAASNGVRYFRSLGAQAAAAMVVTRADADATEIIEPIRYADLIYLTGGSPSYLLDTLRDSAAWAAILERWRAGAMVVGSSAGAMVMGEAIQAGGALLPALGMAPGVVVLPHHRARPAAEAPVWLGQGLVALGVPEATACYSEDNAHWRVIGADDVMVYAATARSSYPSGHAFSLPWASSRTWELSADD